MPQLLQSNNSSIHFFNRDSIEIQESIPVGCVLTTCANCMSFNGYWCQHQLGRGGPEVNKIEQVSIDGHRMSLARGGTKFGGSLHSESNALWVMVRSPDGWRMVKINQNLNY